MQGSPGLLQDIFVAMHKKTKKGQVRIHDADLSMDHTPVFDDLAPEDGGSDSCACGPYGSANSRHVPNFAKMTY